MATERNLIKLRTLLRDPLLSKTEALDILAGINRSEREIPSAEVLDLLQQIDIEDMKKRPHRGKRKTDDRSFGQKLRKSRTGSRRG